MSPDAANEASFLRIPRPGGRFAELSPGNQRYVQKMYLRSAEKAGDVEVVPPWSLRISAEDRAEAYWGLVRASYGLGHPDTEGFAGPDAVAQRHRSGKLLTWVALWRGMAVGMSSLRVLDEGRVSLVGTVELPRGSKLPNGETYDARPNVSALMYRRIADLLVHGELGPSVQVLEGRVRASGPQTISGGRVLPGGAPTQHINLVCEVMPFVLCQPVVHMDQDTDRRAEMYLISRRYTHEDRVCQGLAEVLHLPGAHRPRLNTILAHALDWGPTYGDGGGDAAELRVEVDRNAALSATSLTVSGDCSRELVERWIDEEMQVSTWVELIVPNKPENIALQEAAVAAGATFLGALPGYDCGDGSVETTFHYGVLRSDVRAGIPDIELARDYEGTAIAAEIQSVSDALRSGA